MNNDLSNDNNIIVKKDKSNSNKKLNKITNNIKSENKRSFIVKSNLNIYRNTTNYVEKKKNNINFSYLWLNKKEFRDNHYLSKSYINPFDNIKKNIIKN